LRNSKHTSEYLVNTATNKITVTQRAPKEWREAIWKIYGNRNVLRRRRRRRNKKKEAVSFTTTREHETRFCA
jgi:hypothetical protein